MALKGILSSFRFLDAYRRPLGAVRNYGKDFAVTSQSQDLLLTNLKAASDTGAVLEMVQLHNQIMSNRHVIQALRSLFTLQKAGETSLSTKQILGSLEFQKLCQKLKLHAGRIEVNETIDALKVISYVGVPSNSTIIQVLLQLIRHQINFLSLQQILFLDFLIARFRSSPLVDALQIALPIVFEIHLPVKVDYSNAHQLAEFFYYAAKHSLNDETISKIVGGLLRPQCEFDAKIAKSVIWSICDLDGNETLRPLIEKAFEALMVHLDDLNFVDMETTLSKVTSRFSRRFDYFYNQVFYDTCANHVIDNNMGFSHAVYLLRKFSRVTHYHNGLIDYISTEVYNNPDLITKSTPIDIYSIVVGCSLTAYRPKNWELLKTLILQTENLTNTDKREIIWIKFASALCLLNIYKVDVLGKVLDENFLSSVFKRRYISDKEDYLTCWECIKTYKPELNCLLPARFSPEAVNRLFQVEREYALARALERGLGGEKYVRSGLFTRLGQHVDHLVVFRKGGFPVAVNEAENGKFIEDIEVAAGNQLVVVKALTRFNYTMNNGQLLNSAVSAIEVLENRGYKVVPICVEKWESLADFERIPYLMRAINEKIDSEFSLSENVV